MSHRNMFLYQLLKEFHALEDNIVCSADHLVILSDARWCYVSSGVHGNAIDPQYACPDSRLSDVHPGR
jgi:hypothetical protein